LLSKLAVKKERLSMSSIDDVLNEGIKLIVNEGGSMHAGLRNGIEGTVSNRLWIKSVQPYGEGKSLVITHQSSIPSVMIHHRQLIPINSVWYELDILIGLGKIRRRPMLNIPALNFSSVCVLFP